jgi:hypothetical protein
LKNFQGIPRIPIKEEGGKGGGMRKEGIRGIDGQERRGMG